MYMHKFPYMYFGKNSDMNTYTHLNRLNNNHQNMNQHNLCNNIASRMHLIYLMEY